ncbi:MAG TPA: ABC transporter substrate-binding protein [Methylomirabilota bacterium]|jgi:peptide/nickel transport system substrate-binding protein|nr:ABC transporter substrate-binding protein [Methylomirabilota bacterium]
MGGFGSWRRVSTPVIVGVALALGASASAQEPKPGGVLRVGLQGDFTTMDPHMSTSAEDRDLYYQLYSPLVGLDANLKIVPELAEAWEQPDPLTYVFRLRKGVKFHDGTDLTAEVVKWNFERMLNPATGSIRRSELGNVKSVDVLNPLTVRINLKEPDAVLLATLSDRAGMMVSRAAVEKHGKDFARNPVGTGPFQFVEWAKDDHLTVRRFPGYWKSGLPYLDEIVYKPIPDHSVKLTALRTGTLDLIDDLPPKDVTPLKGNAKLRVIETPGLGYRRIELNHTRPPFNLKALRQAVAWAINREAIHRAVFFGAGAPAQGPIPPRSWAYEPLPGYGTTPDLAKVKEKLAEGGQPNGFRFVLNVVNTPVAQKQAEIIQDNLKRAGIDMEIALLEVGAFDEKRRALQFDGAEGRWSGRVDPDGNMFAHLITGGANNWGKYANPRLDDLLRRARSAAQPGERKRLYAEALRIIIDDVPIVFLHHDAWTKAWDTRVQGYVEIPDGRMRFERVWLGR